MKKFKILLVSVALGVSMFACNDDDNESKEIYDPNTAAVASVDRFSAAAGHLQVRTTTNGLPAANAAVNFDQGPFITKGLGPSGQHVAYYNFDVQSTTPAPIWVLYHEGESTPVSGQLNIIDVLPGENGYNDFWQIVKVTVPADYQANEVASYDEINSRGYKQETTSTLVNCPVVPQGSTASLRLNGESSGIIRGWYKEKVVYYFTFGEKALTVTSGKVPVSPIYVSFNINPDANNANSGPASGFVTENGSTQTHNVVATLPSDAAYSPLWSVSAYDNADFDKVNNIATAVSATSVGQGLANVNCPIVSIP